MSNQTWVESRRLVAVRVNMISGCSSRFSALSSTGCGNIVPLELSCNLRWKWELGLTVLLGNMLISTSKSRAHSIWEVVPGVTHSEIFNIISLSRKTGEWSFMSLIRISAWKNCKGLSSNIWKCSTQGSVRPHSTSRSCFSFNNKSPVYLSKCKRFFPPHLETTLGPAQLDHLPPVPGLSKDWPRRSHYPFPQSVANA